MGFQTNAEAGHRQKTTVIATIRMMIMDNATGKVVYDNSRSLRAAASGGTSSDR